MEKRIIIAGSGGQGILFLGRLIAYSGMLEGKDVTWFPSYGAEMRGGTANCTVILSNEMIGSPVVSNTDFLIVMNKASYNRFLNRVVPNGVLIYDSSLINLNDVKKYREDIKIVKVPASELAATLNSTRQANMVMIGALIAATNILNIASVVKAIEEMTSASRKDFIKINKDLLMLGFEVVSKNKNA